MFADVGIYTIGKGSIYPLQSRECAAILPSHNEQTYVIHLYFYGAASACGGRSVAFVCQWRYQVSGHATIPFRVYRQLSGPRTIRICAQTTQLWHRSQTEGQAHGLGAPDAKVTPH